MSKAQNVLSGSGNGSMGCSTPHKLMARFCYRQGSSTGGACAQNRHLTWSSKEGRRCPELSYKRIRPGWIETESEEARWGAGRTHTADGRLAQYTHNWELEAIAGEMFKRQGSHACRRTTKGTTCTTPRSRLVTPPNTALGMRFVFAQHESGPAQCGRPAHARQCACMPNTLARRRHEAGEGRGDARLKRG